MTDAKLFSIEYKLDTVREVLETLIRRVYAGESNFSTKEESLLADLYLAFKDDENGHA